MKQSETKKLLSMLRAQYQHKFIIDDMTELVWHGLLNDEPELPPEAVFKAAMVWMRDNEWPPQVRDLRDIIASQVNGIPDADAAWTHFSKWLRAGYPGMPDKRPPLPELIRLTVKELGGSSMFYNADNTDRMQKKFVDLYSRKRREQVSTTNVTEAWEARTEIGPGGRVAIDRGVA